MAQKFVFLFTGLAAEHFPVDQQRIQRSLKYLDTNPELFEQMLKIPIVKRGMLSAEKVVDADKSKRENIRKVNEWSKKSQGLE